MASVDSLPQAVASGGSVHSCGDGAFPLKLCEASSDSALEDALPVLALGTQVSCYIVVSLCWTLISCPPILSFAVLDGSWMCAVMLMGFLLLTVTFFGV